MKPYSRVSYAVRCQIDAFLQANLSIPEISKKLGFHKTTIYRELKRNCFWGQYSPGRANRLTTQRYQRCRKRYVIKDSTECIVTAKLAEGWSPEQISGRLKREAGKGPSHQSIYNYILVNDNLKVHLRRPRKRGNGRYLQRKRHKNADYLSVHKRPEIANDRRRVGDWERDTTGHSCQAPGCSSSASGEMKRRHLLLMGSAAILNFFIKARFKHCAFSASGIATWNSSGMSECQNLDSEVFFELSTMHGKLMLVTNKKGHIFDKDQIGKWFN